MRVLSTPDARGWHTAVTCLALALLLTLLSGGVVWLVNAEETAKSMLAVGATSPADAGTDDTLRVSGFGRAEVSRELRVDIPPRASGESRRVLWIERDPVESLWVEVQGWSGPRLDFFKPNKGEGILPTAFVYPVPDALSGEVIVRLHATGTMPVAMQVHVLNEDHAGRRQQHLLALNVMVYSGCLLLALMSVALFWAVRELFFLQLFGTTLLAGLLFMAVNGHLYGFPLLGVFGVLKGQGLWGLVLLYCAAMLALTMQLVDERSHPTQARLVRAVTLLLAAAGALLMLGLEILLPAMQGAALVGCGIVVPCVLWLLGTSVRQRGSMALPALLLFLLLLVASLARIGLSQGMLPDTIWIRYGYQLASVALLAVLALALMGRIGVYRQQRDDARDARIASERRMERESGRAALARLLQGRLRDLAPDDIEWTAFRLLFEHLLPHVPVASAVVIAHGYHGRDVLVSEPLDDKRVLQGLEGARLLMLKRQSQAGRPVQHRVEMAGTGRMEAVIPIPVGPQAWGALLLQRADGTGFSDEELSLAHEFVRLTALHCDEAVATQALRRTAERDALTGAHNRRGIDQWLARQFSRKQPNQFSLLYVDLDHFKPINDLYGHACGDQCLRNLSMTMRARLRPNDMLGRYGGEEFIILLPDTDLTRARGIAESLRGAVEESYTEWQGQRLQVTVSIGIAARAASDTSAAALLDRADAALYEAKRGGRNRVAASKAQFDS